MNQTLPELMWTASRATERGSLKLFFDEKFHRKLKNKIIERPSIREGSGINLVYLYLSMTRDRSSRSKANWVTFGEGINYTIFSLDSLDSLYVDVCEEDCRKKVARGRWQRQQCPSPFWQSPQAFNQSSITRPVTRRPSRSTEIWFISNDPVLLKANSKEILKIRYRLCNALCPLKTDGISRIGYSNWENPFRADRKTFQLNARLFDLLNKFIKMS